MQMKEVTSALAKQWQHVTWVPCVTSHHVKVLGFRSRHCTSKSKSRHVTLIRMATHYMQVEPPLLRVVGILKGFTTKY
jgi:hypothetical protein